jgi:hypothetical protein
MCSTSHHHIIVVHRVATRPYCDNHDNMLYKSHKVSYYITNLSYPCTTHISTDLYKGAIFTYWTLVRFAVFSATDIVDTYVPILAGC